MEQMITWAGLECVRQLGAGSFGKVYEIQKNENGKIYKSALKVIRIPQHDADIENAYSEGLDQNGVTEYFRSFVNDFSNEIALMSDLKGYTNIVSYEDHKVIEHKDKIGWDILIKMELLTPFLEWEKEHSLQEDDIIRLGCDICRALELCHNNKIIHRDIKPQNIFVNKNGDFKLGDFGIARIVDRTNTILSSKGACYFMAPEVYKGMKYDITTDIYSLGLVLYHCLNNNRPPFLAMGSANVIERNNAHERRLSGETIPEPANGSKKLKKAVLMTLHYDPKKRIRSAAALRNILEQCSSRGGAVPQTIQPQVPPLRHYVLPVQTEEPMVPKSMNSQNSAGSGQYVQDDPTVLNIQRIPVQQKRKTKQALLWL